MSEILDRWIAGEGLPGVLALDGHLHIGEWPTGTTFPNAERAAEESVAYMDANGIDAGVTVGGGYMWTGTDYRLGNDFLLDVCGRIPERLVGFASVNPNDERENILSELDRAFDAGIRGIKLINSYQENYPGDGPDLMAVYEFAAEHSMIVFNHWWDPGVMDRIAGAFPNIDFIAGHYGRGYDPVLKSRPNAYANIWSVPQMGELEAGIRDVGPEKLMMGSDGFMNPLSCGIAPVVFAPIPDEDKRLMLGLTMARLLDKVGVLPEWVREKM